MNFKSMFRKRSADDLEAINIVDADKLNDFAKKVVIKTETLESPIPLSTLDSTLDSTKILCEIRELLKEYVTHLAYLKEYVVLEKASKPIQTSDETSLHNIQELLKHQIKQAHFLNETVIGAIGAIARNEKNIEVVFPSAGSTQLQSIHNNAKVWIVRSCRDFSSPVPLETLINDLENDGWTVHSVLSNSSDVVFVMACKDRQ